MSTEPQAGRREVTGGDPLLAAVTAGVRLVELGHPFFTGMPCSPNHPGFRMSLIRRHGDMVRPAVRRPTSSSSPAATSEPTSTPWPTSATRASSTEGSMLPRRRPAGASPCTVPSTRHPS